ncbi:MAG TPA: tetratricopeptide repeat protein [Kiritimatiellia bacterium]|nr:tetratricopeptide repeat protein [Kiritimatiellia bacterium]HMP33754.1 tetratricopeptide repeat protein [Kiritimatiellia bacterium]
MRMRTCGWVLLGLMGAGAGWADYLGAEKLLASLAVEPAPVEKADGATVWLNDLKALEDGASALAADEAARAWLDLYDRLLSLRRQDLVAFASSEDQAPSMARLILALPSPEAWDALAGLVDARPEPKDPARRSLESLLRMLVHTLTGQTGAFMTEAESLIKRLGDEGKEGFGSYLVDHVVKVMKAKALIAGDASMVVAFLEQDIAARQVGDEDEEELQLPDLVTLLGAEEAERLLRQALVLPNTTVTIRHGSATKQLARELAVELVPQMRSPQWAMAHSLDGLNLFEALQQAFPEGDVAKDPAGKELVTMNTMFRQVMGSLSRSVRGSVARDLERSPRQRAFRTAQGYYLLGLIVADRIEDAHRVAAAIPETMREQVLSDDVFRQLEQYGYTGQVQQWLERVLEEDPGRPFWKYYMHVSVKLGKGDAMVAFVDRYAASEQVSQEQREELDALLQDARLAVDQVDEGVALLRSRLADAVNNQKETAVELGLTLARLGRLLQQESWVEEGLAAAQALLFAPGRERGFGSSDVSSLVHLLVATGRGPEAEALLQQSLKEHRAARDSDYGFMSSYGMMQDMATLAGLYHAAGRFDDVVVLLDRNPWWGVADLADLAGSYFGYGFGGKSESFPSISVIAADALRAAGREAEAVRILEAELLRRGGYDPAYERFVAIKGLAAVEHLDRLYALDPYEERPLIWKAHLLRLDGQLDAAKAVAQQAVAVDPSDGEQGRGTRMRVYEELGAMAEAQGDGEQAAFLAGVIRAIRLSEEADAFYDAGLIARGVALYEEALGYFADAYCIQSRMAIQLEELGRLDEAERHYQRAYELMPDSFGKVESHCFGCEGAFDSPRAQGIAERVFTSLVEQNPEKPQVHYLLGYLRMEQGRYAEALDSFRQATERAPDYLNAWKKMGELGEYMQVPVEDRDAVVFTALRLDPLSRHGRPDIDQVHDLRALWRVVEATRAKVPEPPKQVYPLAASAQRLEEEKKMEGDARRRGRYRPSFRISSNDSIRTPGAMIAYHEVIRELVQMMQQQISMSAYR